ncbi:TOG domain-containing protein [Mycena chlorophos]|uniref:TOG domain-containing protein n=1 Tax=Mycena chlorophos TaxID=658473 RepID=A0A8H6SET7_MYCCL|nr:TOG domain-containing protein [Mycena chlorophos]
MDIQEQVDSVRSNLCLPETEESWDTILRAINTLSLVCGDVDAFTPAELVAAIRPLHRPIISAMNSERGRLSGAAMDLVAILASSLGVAFDPLLHHLFPVLLTLSSRTSKVTLNRARACILSIINATQLPSILSYLLQSSADKSISLRLTVVESALACLNCFNPPDLEKDAKAKEIEAIIRVASRDASGDVRKVARKMFEAYKVLLPSRIDRFVAPLSPTTRKYLDIQHKPVAPPPPKAAQLSASTSALRPAAPERPKAHVRSASASADAAGTRAAKPERPKPVEVTLPLKPTNAIFPVRQVPTAPPVERPRVVSMSAAIRPASRTRTEVEVKQPTPITTQPVRRLLPEKEKPAPAPVVVARRVLVTEIQPAAEKAAEKAAPGRGRVPNSVSTPAIRPVPFAPSKPTVAPTKPAAPPSKPNVVKPVVARPPAPPVPTAGPSKRAPVAQAKPPVQKTASKHKESAKSSLMKPTLAQIARTKEIERKVAAAASGAQSRVEKRAPRKAPLPPRKPMKPSESKSPTETIVEEPEDAPAEESGKRDVVENGGDEHKAEEDATAEDVPSADSEEKRAPTPVQVPKVTVDSLDLATPQRIKPRISELLRSIERGFLLSPSAPLSPPDSYLSMAATGAPIAFPMWPPHPPQEHTPSLKPFEVIRQLEPRKALGNVETNM